QVDHHVRPGALQACSQASRIANVDLREFIVADMAQVFQVGLLQVRRIEFVQVIENPKLGAATKQGLSHMRANEAGSACQHNTLRRSAHRRLCALLVETRALDAWPSPCRWMSDVSCSRRCGPPARKPETSVISLLKVSEEFAKLRTNPPAASTNATP